MVKVLEYDSYIHLNTHTYVHSVGENGQKGEKGEHGDTGAQGQKGQKGQKGGHIHVRQPVQKGEQGQRGQNRDQGGKGQKGDSYRAPEPTKGTMRPSTDRPPCLQCQIP